MLRVKSAVPVLVMAITMAIACGTQSRGQGNVAQGNVDHANDRILAIGGDVTEILYALDLGARIVAVDTTSQFPPDALRDKKSVGYMRALSPEGTLSVGANLVIASDRAGPADVVNALKSAVRYVEVSEGATAEGVPAKVISVATAAGSEAAGRRLADTISSQLAALDTDRRKIEKRARALFILNVQGGRVVLGGSNTSADAMLKLSGLDNAAGDIAGFKPAGEEALFAMNPDIVVVMRTGAGGGHDVAQVLSLPGLAGTKAGRENRLIAMDALYLLGLGPRVAMAARDLMRQAYPDLSGPKSETTR